MNEPESRTCPISARTVIFSPLRAARPMTLRHSQPHSRSEANRSHCPFCPGNEHETPADVFTTHDEHGWQLRVLPNKYPAVDLASDTALGIHELFIPCREHYTTPTQLSEPQLGRLLLAYADRIRACWDHPQLNSVNVFQNVGAEAGASLAHLHSQLIALPFIPAELAREYEQLKKAGVSHCPICEMAGHPSRMIARTANFVATCPYAPRFSHEIWLLPQEHRSRYETITLAEATELGQLVRRVLNALDCALDSPAYNWFLHTSPRADQPHYHWHFELIPRTSRLAGFEWGTGVFINSVFPERAAQELRDKLPP
jgi:UDPglucose--hexose-1-phosphate uridylyltransferase